MHSNREEKAVTRNPSHRRGYALLLVIAFVVLFTAILGVAWRRVISALRIEHVSEVRRQCDQGSIQALAKAIQVLETRLRRYTLTDARLDGSGGSSLSYAYNLPSTAQWYTVTFARETTDTDGTKWAVSVTTASSDPGLPLLPSNPP
jgi:hypothetical protein